ncbi:MAG: hypothetical protein HZC28_07370 [Spirochaetes bacterium]|nr:hypothetical protein [Spirochaetota bacterium]
MKQKYLPIHVNSEYNYSKKRERLRQEYANGEYIIAVSFGNDFHIIDIRISEVKERGFVVVLCGNGKLDNYFGVNEESSLGLVETSRLRTLYRSDADKERFKKALDAVIADIKPSVLKDAVTNYHAKGVDVLSKEFILLYFQNALRYFQEKPLGLINDWDKNGNYKTRYIYRKKSIPITNGQLKKMIRMNDYPGIEKRMGALNQSPANLISEDAGLDEKPVPEKKVKKTDVRKIGGAIILIVVFSLVVIFFQVLDIMHIMYR